jgi:hypothetical protein
MKDSGRRSVTRIHQRLEIAIELFGGDQRISIYVLGDEFTGESIQVALDAIDRVNKPDQGGRRRVRIHAGRVFPSARV